MTEHHPPYHVMSLTFEPHLSMVSPAQSREEMRGTITYRPLPPNAEHTCSLFDCGDAAVWGIYPQGETRPILVLCDRCRQEWERSDAAYATPDGWDWDDDEQMLPLLKEGKEEHTCPHGVRHKPRH